MQPTESQIVAGKENTASREAVLPAAREIVRRAEGEYREMPGLSLTLRQAARLWGLDCDTCERVLATLVERRVLKRRLNGTYIRSASG